MTIDNSRHLGILNKITAQNDHEFPIICYDGIFDGIFFFFEKRRENI